MARPRLFDTDTVIEQLCDYFWQHGYDATSLDDLAQRLNLNRGSLYNAFGSKEALMNAAFARYEQKFRAAFNTPYQGKRALDSYFANLVEAATTQGLGRGCFLVNLLMSAKIPTTELQEAVDGCVALMKKFLHEHLEHAWSEGQLQTELSVEEGVNALFATAIGIFALARMSTPHSTIQQFVNNNFRGVFAK